MSLPPGFLDDLRDRTSIAQVVGRKVVWDQRKSNPGKGDWWAPCPFHQEKTASFHVDDRKGFYYCFGCHAKGDAVTFLREAENMSFLEAVETLAQEAGLQMPARDPAAARRAEERAGLAEIMEMAVRFFRLQLSTTAAAEARAYLDRRGLGEAARTRFELGFAPDGRTALAAHLKEKGVAEARIVEAGLAIKPEDGAAAFDRFRGRIMFPIRDARERCIAFGGRAMDPNARAKYLNSPETPLFDKGRALYHVGPARTAAGKTGQLIVAEGYMDVIALALAGFEHAVAPLGTAITEDQLAMLWRIAPEPVIALDGDAAGLRAAMRVAELALPHLRAGQGLRFAILPEGLDPDDLIRAQGRGAMQAVIERAEPMVEILWRRETENRIFDSPERRAALDAGLRAILGRIADQGLREHYKAAFRDRRRALFGGARPGGCDRCGRAPGPGGRPRRSGRFAPDPMPLADTRNSLLAQGAGAEEAAARVREGAILAGCLNHPDIARSLEAELEDLSFLCRDLDRIRTALLQALADDLDTAPTVFAETVAAGLGDDSDPLTRLGRIGQIRTNPHLGADADPAMARAAVEEEIRRHRALTGALAELREAELEIEGIPDEGLTWRLQQATQARDAAVRSAIAPGTETTEDAGALSAHLQTLIDNRIWLKKKT